MRTAYLFDLDGTLTREELLPRIAREIDLEDEMRLLTELTISNVIPFEASFKLRFAILRSVPAQRVRAAIATVEIEPMLARFVAERPGSCFIATGNLENWIGDLARRLGCEVFANRAEETEGHLTHLEPLMLKSKPVRLLKERFERVVAIGDGANDVPMFETADVGIAYGGVHPPFTGLVEIADYIVYDSEALCRLLNTL